MRNNLSWILVCAAVSAAQASPKLRLDPTRPGRAPTASVCSGEKRCLAHVRVAPDGTIHNSAVPDGFGPADLQAAYQIDPNAIVGTPVVAIIDAFGYKNLEADLGHYRATFGLPPCTKANGCLTIVNQDGKASPLPPDPPANDDWTVETALDVDMVSAACPKCKIVVIQANSDQDDGLFIANNTAATLGVTTVSNSWGAPETAQNPFVQLESFFNHPGLAIFASGGDTGFDSSGAGPGYPATSAFVIGVGGTSLFQDNSARGFSESTWVDGGAGCSLSIPKPSFQNGISPCDFRASTDLSAVADPQTGVAVFNTNAGGFTIVGGTSAASPLVASMFAASGHGDATPALIAANPQAFFDVVDGSDGNCGNVLCNAGPGWDGPTGVGTPSGAALSGGGGNPPPPPPPQLAVQITSPSNGATVEPGFEVDATATGPVAVVGLGIDGTLVATATGAPFVFTAPSDITPGMHDVEVAAADANNNTVETHITVIVQESGPHLPPGGLTNGDNGDSGGCNVAQGTSVLPAGLALIGLVGLRRRRATRARA
jgi:hypothetical protein